MGEPRTPTGPGMELSAHRSVARSSPGDGGQAQSASQDSVDPPSVLTALEDRLCLPLQTPLMPGPPRVRRSRTPAQSPLRRSVRIAAAPREADSTKQAQLVLMRKLGVAPTPAVIDSDMVRKYKYAFREPLTESGHEALQLLMGGDFDPIAWNLNMLGLEEEDI